MAQAIAHTKFFSRGNHGRAKRSIRKKLGTEARFRRSEGMNLPCPGYCPICPKCDRT